jgi:Domain of unknown function (DUF5666)
MRGKDKTMKTKIRMPMKRSLAAIVVAGSLVASGAAFAATHAGNTTVAAATPSGTVSTALTATGTGMEPHGGYGHGGRLGLYGRGGDLTVTKVNGDTITATGRAGQTVTVQVSATTTYTKAGTAASLADIHAGSVIAVQGSSASTSAPTINATAITILLPTEVGVVTNVSGNTLTLTAFDGATHTVTVSASTRYQKVGQNATLGDISAGTAIMVEGTLNSDGSLSALRVTIQEPRVAGQVTAVNGSSYTVTGAFGQSYTVTTTSSTTYVNADGTTASASTVQAGVAIIAQGTLSSDGKTLTAQRVIIVLRGAGYGGGHFGFGGPGGGRFGFGGPGGAFGPPPGTTAPNTTGTPSA